MQIRYRTIRTGDEDGAAAVVIAAFEKFIASGYSDEGVEKFRGYAHATSLRARRTTGQPHHQIVAIAPAGMTHGGRTLSVDAVVGVGEVRAWEHLSMLFVHPDWSRLGIGRELFARIRAEVVRENSGLAKLSVNSSPFAVPIYQRLGFEIAGAPLLMSGIEHIPMTFDLG